MDIHGSKEESFLRELLTTLCRGHEIELLWQPTIEEIPAYMEQGFVPIEMSEGTHSFADFRRLDHHNEYSAQPSACVTALNFWGELAEQRPARIMVNHADSDCVITGLTLLGLMPRELHERLNPEVGLVDTAPVGVDYSKLEFGGPIRVWKNAMQSVKQSGWCWLYGLSLWIDLLERPKAYQNQIGKLDEMEAERVKTALEDYKHAVISPSGRVALVMPSRVRGYEVHFFRQPEYLVESLKGWRHWCIIAYNENSGSVLLSCPNPQVAEAAFGPGGLKNVFALLPSIDGKEWGGRESVGGSPRGVLFPKERMAEVLAIIDGALKTC